MIKVSRPKKSMETSLLFLLKKIIQPCIRSSTFVSNYIKGIFPKKMKKSLSGQVFSKKFEHFFKNRFFQFVSDFLAIPVFVYFLFIAQTPLDNTKIYISIVVCIILIVSALSNLYEFKDIPVDEVENSEKKAYFRFLKYLLLTCAAILGYNTLNINNISSNTKSIFMIYLAFGIANFASIFYIEKAKLQNNN